MSVCLIIVTIGEGRREEREERENRRRFNNVNDDWNYPNRYGERGGGGYNGGGR